VEVCKKLETQSLQAAQQTDPYADSYRQQQIEHSNQNLAKAIAARKTVIFCAFSSFWQASLAARTTAITVDAPNGGRGG
jgi:hypothetical protein